MNYKLYRFFNKSVNFFIFFIFLSNFFNVYAQSSTKDTLVFYLKPLYDSNGKAKSIHVSYEVIFEDNLRSHDLNLNLDLMGNLGRNTDQISNLLVKDNDGIVNVNPVVKDKVNNAMVYKTARQVNGKVTVEYTIAAANPVRKGGSNIDMQASGGGLTGSFISILLLPPYENEFFVKLEWDLAVDVTAVSSFGVGNATSPVKLALERLLYAQFIVGHLNMYPFPLPEKGFSVAGLGLNDESIGNSLSNYQKVYEYLRIQFHASPDLAFRFFFRSYTGLPYSTGSAVQGKGYGSFLLYIPPFEKLRDNDKMLALVSHEMLHVFMMGVDEEWYREGIAEYLSTILPYNGKFYSDTFYLESINEKAAQYYSNTTRMLPDSALAAQKFSATNSWSLPYTRGFLYFANLDTKLKTMAKVNGTSVLSLALKIQELGKTEEITENTWIELIRKEAGNWAVEDWKDMKDGKLIRPFPGTFGQKFASQRIKAGIFDLGFNKSVGITKGMIVSELVKNSNASKSGIRNGDEIIESVALLEYYGSYDKILTVKIKRGNKNLSFSYSPRRESVESYRWVIEENKK